LAGKNLIGLRHLWQAGGGGFFGVIAHADQAQALPNSQSPMVAWGGAVISLLLRETTAVQWSILITIRNREQKEGGPAARAGSSHFGS
jgi:hypothetical protein